MGVVTKIAWCDHTFNPWWGCTQVSPLCDHCYAMMLDIRWFQRAHWGPGVPRRYFGGAHWHAPLKWDRSAQQEGRRHRVFCASMADVFDNEVDQVRDRLWWLTRQTPNLDWIVLTKRIGYAPDMLPEDWGAGYPNVWLLVSVDQTGIERDTPKLLDIPAVVQVSASNPNWRRYVSAASHDDCSGSSTAENPVPGRGHFISNGPVPSSPNAEAPAPRSICKSSAATRSKVGSGSGSMTMLAVTGPSGRSTCGFASSRSRKARWRHCAVMPRAMLGASLCSAGSAIFVSICHCVRCVVSCCNNS